MRATGLSGAEASRRLQQYGPNEVRERPRSPWVALAGKLWGPVPWMLQAAAVLSLALGRTADALIILFLLVFNAAVGYLQEHRADNALALLRRRLAVNARVLRDGQWRLIAARELVPGDLVHVRAGDILPGDLRLLDGHLLLDQSALTGEAFPREASPPAVAYAGSVVQRGEATGEVIATGPRTYFGRTAQLVQAARTVTHLEETIFAIVRYLVAIDLALVVAVLAYAAAVHLPVLDVVPFALMVLIASVPVALPATFTVAQALGALELSRRGVLVTRLSAVEEAAMMDVLCVDKTGTLTLNELALDVLDPCPPYSPDRLLELAAVASDEASQDPIDLAILRAARQKRGPTPHERLSFTPFDPATRRTEALIREGTAVLKVVKGMPEVVAGLIREPPPDLSRRVDTLASQGYRVIAVAAGPDGALGMVGLAGFVDPPRPDSQELVRELGRLGVQIKMVTGDIAPTALAIAGRVGIGRRACGSHEVRGETAVPLDRCDIFAGVFPEEKYQLVRRLQREGHIVGMTGDGVNDAPALKRAEVGIAVSTATDVAKAAASIVLTSPGLVDIVTAIRSSRRTYQRMLTYTLNKIVKTLQVAVFLSAGFLLTGTFVATPFLIVLLLFANDFVTMSIATDRVGYSSRPDRWRIGSLVAAAGLLALGVLAESFLVLYLAMGVLHLELPRVQTMVFTMLVFSGQANVYLVRVRQHFWKVRPSGILLAASVGDILAVSFLAARGVLMAPLDLWMVLGVLGIAAAFVVLMDPLKVAVFQRAGLA